MFQNSRKSAGDQAERSGNISKGVINMSNPKEGSKLKVGFIGLGRMGQGMSKRILDAGNDVVVYDVIPAATKVLGDVGAAIAPTVSDACKGRDVVITMLAEDYVVKEVMLG